MFVIIGTLVLQARRIDKGEAVSTVASIVSALM
jgi:hypothetical protein